MRSLRSGKSLPDSPPVMRQRPAAVAKPSNLLLVPKTELNESKILEDTKDDISPMLLPGSPGRTSTPLPTNKVIENLLDSSNTTSEDYTLDSKTEGASPKRVRGRPPKQSTSPIRVTIKLKTESPLISGQGHISRTSIKREKMNNASDNETDVTNTTLDTTIEDVPQTTESSLSSSNENVNDVVKQKNVESSRQNSQESSQKTLEEPSQRLSKTNICQTCGAGFHRKATLQMHQKKCKEILRLKKQAEESRAAAVAAAEAKKEKQKEKLQSPVKVKKEKESIHVEPEEAQEDSTSSSSQSSPMKASRSLIIPFTKKRPSIPSLALKDPVKCDQCGMTFTRRAHLNRHMLLHSGVKPYVCDVCDIRFTRKDHMLAHKQKHEKGYDNDQPTIPCEQCGMNFLSYKSLERHMQSEHLIPNFSPPRHVEMLYSNIQHPGVASTSISDDIVCELCGKKFLQKRYLRAHKKIHIMKGDYSFSSGGGLNDQQNDDNQYYDSYEQNMDEEDINSMVNHPMRSSSRQIHKTIVTTTSPNNSRRSLVLNNRLVKLSSDLAKKSLNNSSNSEADISSDRNIDGEGEYEDMDYDYEAMGKHFPAELEGVEEDYEQDNENESSEDNSSQDPDQTQQKELECSVCGKPFLDRMELRKHYRVHKKRFICRFCGLRLASAGSLMRHNLIHTGKKQFECKLCGRKFSRKDTLAVHIQAHKKAVTRVNMSRPYLCKICGAGYTMKYNLIRHIKMCHSFSKSSKHVDAINRFRQENDRLASLAHDEINGIENDDDGNLHNDNENNTKETTGEDDSGMVIALNPLDLLNLESGEGLNSTSDYHYIKNENGECFEGNEETEVMEGEGLDRDHPEGYESNGSDGQAPDGKYPCQHCGKTFKNAKSLNTHKWYHSRDKQFLCHICNRGFKYSTDLGRHVLTHTNDASLPTLASGSENSATNNKTNQSMRPPPPLQPQPKVGTPQIAQQNQYQRTFGRGRNINAIDTRPFGCKLCPQRFNHRSNLSRHMRLLHNGTSMRKRPIFFNPVQRVTNFARTNNPTVMYQNDITSGEQEGDQESWMQWDGMNMPGKIDTSHTAADTIARKLEPQFRRLSAANMSPDSFTYDPNSDRPYSCNSCGKAFENKNNLWTHMRIHNKAFECSFCGLKVATRGDLILHLRTHTGEKPYSCTAPLCEWKFSRKSGLNKHILKYHSPGGKVLRPWKYRDEAAETLTSSSSNSSTNPSLKFKITRSPEQAGDFHIEQLQRPQKSQEDVGNSSNSVQISKVVGGQSNRPLPRLIPANTNVASSSNQTNPILKSALQQQSHSVLHQQIGGVTISRIINKPQVSQNPNTEVKEISTNKSGVSITPVPQQKQNPSLLFLCRKCGALVTGKHNYIEHMKTHQNANVESAQVAYTQQSIKPTNSSGMKQSSNQNPYRCQECGETFSEQLHLTRHSMAHSQPSKCKLCGKVCSSVGFLSRHYQYMHPDMPNPAEEARFKLSESSTEQLNKVKTIQNKKEGQMKIEANVEVDDDDEDEEFPEETDGPPNRVMPGSSSTIKGQDDDEQSEAIIKTAKDEDFELQYSSRPFTTTKMGWSGMSVSAVSLDQPTPCDRCGKEFTNKKARSDHIWYCKREKIHRCPVSNCRKEFKLKHDVMRHLIRHTNERRFACPVCKSRFFHKQDVERHLRSVHKLTPQGNPFPCDFCDKKLVSEQDLNTHMRSVHGIDYSEIFTQEESSTNVEEVFDDEEINPAEYYEGRFQNNEYDNGMDMEEYEDGEDGDIPDPSSFLEQSMEDEDQQQNSYNCDVCPKTFSTRQKLMYHKYYHIREAKFGCEHCEERFKLRSHLERHIRTYHNEEKPVNPSRILICPACPRKFTRDYDLSTHILKVHTGDTSIQQQSNTTANSMSILKSTLIQKKTAPIIKPSSTVQANKSSNFFSQKTYTPPSSSADDSIKLGLDGHYSCNLCGKTFVEKKSADAHRYYHNREEKYFCSFCSARFKQNSDLNRHVRIHHNSKNPKKTIHCPHCYRSFTDDRYLRMHIRRNHSGSNEVNINGSEADNRASFDSSLNDSSEEKVSEYYDSPVDNSELFDETEQSAINPEEYLEEDDDTAELAEEASPKDCSESWNEGENLVDMTLIEDDEENEKIIETWNNARPQEQMEHEEEEDPDQRNMEEMEYLNYSKEEYSVACESCGTILEDDDSISQHVCSGTEDVVEVKKKPQNMKVEQEEESSTAVQSISKNGNNNGDLVNEGDAIESTQSDSPESVGDNDKDLQAKGKIILECPLCPKRFEEQETLDAHMRRNHAKIISLHNCKKCLRVYTSRKSLEEHEKDCED